MRFLIQTQLSNYDTNGKFILECDSGWNMCLGRVREILKLSDSFEVEVMAPLDDQVITKPEDLNSDLIDSGRLKFIKHYIVPNALATRYDFNFTSLSNIINLNKNYYDFVYINDPMLFRNFKALFFLKAGYLPKFIVHSHFIDNPECPKFPKEASLWLGQCEAAIMADYNFWQCESAMNIFFKSMEGQFNGEVVDHVISKSSPWDDGYSSAEINIKPNMNNVRFSEKEFFEKTKNKTIIFVPNRIGGMGRSSDYTNCGKFMFELLPQLAKVRNDFVVLAGNPSQKFTNDELSQLCGQNGYIKLVPDSFNRDEFRFVARNSDISLGLYDQDSYGGTVARECVDLGMLPFWLDNYEYSSIAKLANYPYLAKPDWSDFIVKLNDLIEDHSLGKTQKYIYPLKKIVYERCSYESTTEKSLKIIGAL